MGTLRGDNGGGERPQEGGGLPDLPPEWGTIIIPDDAGVLDDEGTLVRRQFRRAAMRRRWRRRMHLPAEPIRRATEDSPGLAVPLLIMSIAVIATLVSLFAVAWPGHSPHGTPHVGTASPPPVVSLAKLSLSDAAGSPVPLAELTPAVILLVEGCTCEKLIASTVDAIVALHSAKPPALLVVAIRVPPLPGNLNTSDALTVRALADPNNSLRAAIPTLSNDRTSSAVLIAQNGIVVKAIKAVTSPTDFAETLPKLQ